jgi:hypothetical protein
MRLSGAPQWIGGCHRGATGRPSAHAVGSRTGPNARSSVSLVDALLPGGILATSGLTRNTRTRLALGHVSREATNFCLTFALLVLI